MACDWDALVGRCSRWPIAETYPNEKYLRAGKNGKVNWIHVKTYSRARNRSNDDESSASNNKNKNPRSHPLQLVTSAPSFGPKIICHRRRVEIDSEMCCTYVIRIMSPRTPRVGCRFAENKSSWRSFLLVFLVIESLCLIFYGFCLPMIDHSLAYSFSKLITRPKAKH